MRIQRLLSVSVCTLSTVGWLWAGDGEERAVLERYCYGCHNEKVKSGFNGRTDKFLFSNQN